MSRRSIACVLIAVALAYWAGAGGVSPIPQPGPSRPRLAWVMAAAKKLLWAAAFFEAPPEEHDSHAVEAQERVVRAAAAEIGDDGFPIVNHVRGL
jgi:hypothetical protein